MPIDKSAAHLAALRALRGWALTVVAERAGVLVADAERAERGEGSLAALVALADVYGLDLHALRRGELCRPEMGDEGSVFLFHTDRVQFMPADLPVFADALHDARRWVGTAAGRRGLVRRLRFSPSRVAGLARPDAARQGHHHARAVRANLGLGGEPAPDLRELAEQELGVAVMVRSLSSPGLHAGAVLDAERAGAGIVLNKHWRSVPTRGIAVEVAHELGHLLFDPAPAGAVQLALDGSGFGQEADLREARARGFAAEFLLPFSGLRALLGAPNAEADEQEAHDIIHRVRSHFETTWELTANHLYNLGYLSKLAWEAVRFRRPPPEPPTGFMLPAPGAPPLCLSAVPLSSVEDAAGLAWRVAAEVVDEVRAEVERRASPLHQAVSTLCARGQPEDAGIHLARFTDEAMEAGDLALAAFLVGRADGTGLPAEDLLGLLGNTALYRPAIAEPRLELLDRTLRRLRDEGWSDTEISEARAQLA